MYEGKRKWIKCVIVNHFKYNKCLQIKILVKRQHLKESDLKSLRVASPVRENRLQNLLNNGGLRYRDQ